MNTPAYNVYLLVTGVAVVAVMLWVLQAGLRTGELPIRFGYFVRRRERPVEFWFVATLIVTLLVAVSVGVGFAALDLVSRP